MARVCYCYNFLKSSQSSYVFVFQIGNSPEERAGKNKMQNECFGH